MSSTERTAEGGPVALVTEAAGGTGEAVVAGQSVLTVDGGWTAR